MKLKMYQVEAFCSDKFKGNPAAVIPLEDWLDPEIMQKIAADINLSETAFYIQEEEGFDIKWFTPTTEVALCGHATLASAHVLYQHQGYEGELIKFGSKSGFLAVQREGDQYILDFPTDEIEEADLPTAIIMALGVEPVEVYKGREDFMVVLETQKEVERLRPDFEQLARIKSRGFIITAPGDEVDFVSRCFFPNAGINEDPVTGSAHTTMTQYWAEEMRKDLLIARQLSKRGGELSCRYLGNRTLIGGAARTYLESEIEV